MSKTVYHSGAAEINVA